MVKAAEACRQALSGTVHQAQGVARFDVADARHGHGSKVTSGQHRIAVLRCCGEEQLIVVTPGQQALLLHGCRLRSKHRAARQFVHLHHGTHARALQHMAQVAHQADALEISVRTVEVHRARVFDKMNVKSAVELANRLRDSGLGG